MDDELHRVCATEYITGGEMADELHNIDAAG